MIGFLRGLRALILLMLLSPFIVMAIVFSFIQRFGGVEADDTIIGKINKYLF